MGTSKLKNTKLSIYKKDKQDYKFETWQQEITEQLDHLM